MERAEAHGGLISYRSEGNGIPAPYEINITWFSALNREGSEEPLELQVARFLASRALAMSLRGVPGIYLHSLFGTQNDREAVTRTGVNRDINRRTVDYDALLAAMEDSTTSIAQILCGVKHLLKTRTRERAFHPRGPQRVLDLDRRCFGLARQSPEGDRLVLALTNISPEPMAMSIPLDGSGKDTPLWRNLLDGRSWIQEHGLLSGQLGPYEVAWLVPAAQYTPREEPCA